MGPADWEQYMGNGLQMTDNKTFVKAIANIARKRTAVSHRWEPCRKCGRGDNTCRVLEETEYADADGCFEDGESSD